MLGQLRQVGDAGREGRGCHARLRADDADDVQRLAAVNQLSHIGVVIRHILPHAVLLVVAVAVAGVDELEGDLHQLVVGPAQRFAGIIDLLAGYDVGHHLAQILLVAQAEGVGHEVRHAARVGQHQQQLVVFFGPAPGQHVILRFEQRRVVDHFGENVGVGEGHGRHRPHHRGKQRVGVDLQQLAVHVGGVELRRNAVAVLQGVDAVLHLVVVLGEVFLEGGQVVAADLSKDLRHHLLLADGAGRHVIAARHHRAERAEHGCHIGRFGVDGQRVGRERILLHRVDIARHSVRDGIDECDADDADAAGKGGQHRAALFGQQVLEGKPEGGQDRHRGPLGVAADACSLFGGQLLGAQRGAVAGDGAVEHADDAGRVALGQLWIMGHHDDQPLGGDLLEDLHDLHAGLGVEGAGRLVGQNDIGVVDDGAGNGNALHLPARHFGGLFDQLAAQPDALQRFFGALAALGLGDARKRQRQLDVLQHRLVRDEVVALKDKADRVVAVAVPIAVVEVLGRDTADDQVAAGGLIQPADDVEQRRFAAA